MTTIDRDNTGVPTAIVGPYGHRTALVIDANGQLAAITPANGLAFTLGFSSDGLLNSASNSAGLSSGNSYDGDGRLLGSTGPGGSSVAMSIVPLPFGSSVSVSTAEGVNVKLTYGTDMTGVRSTVRETGAVRTTVLTFPDGSSESRLPDGTVVKTMNAPDPRFGLVSPLTSTTTMLPSGLTYTQRMGAAVVRNPLDEDEFNVETDSSIVNGRVTTALYDHLTQRAIFTTPSGQTRVLRMNDPGQVISDSISGLAAIVHDVTPSGLLSSLKQAGREWHFTYDATGRVTKATDPLNRLTQYLYDANDNVSAEISPSGDTTFRSIDVLGRLTVLKTGLGRAHRFSYTPDDHLASYDMPDVGQGTTSIRATYDKDGNRTTLIRGSGDTVSFAYDQSGRPTAVRAPHVARTFSFDPITGLPRTVTDGANQLALQFDGSLLTGQTYTGEVNGSIASTYTNNLTLRTQIVSGGATVMFHHDVDLRIDWT